MILKTRFMSKTTLGKWTLGIVGTVVLGALGSGLWDVALKNVFTALGRAMLTGISFVYVHLNDTIYLEIAKGHTDRVSLWLVSCFALLFGSLTGLATGYLSIRYANATHVQNAHGEPCKLKPLQRFLICLSDKRKVLNGVVLLSTLFLVSIFLVQSCMLFYVSNAITQYEQEYAICLPFLNDHDRAFNRSQFAQIRTREDYERVLQILQQVAATNNIALPKFNIW
jgi:hypothetical protein